MNNSTVRLKVASQTDIGRNPARIRNEDFWGQYEGDYGRLFIVCDGMGGHVAGEVASRLVVESIRNYFETSYIPGEENNTIALAVDSAQDKILDAVNNNPNLTGMGSTVVLLLIQETKYWFAHSGDSRLYLSRDGSINQLTKDHSEVQRMVDNGEITLERAASHPQRNIITRAIGNTNYKPEIAGPLTLKQDDVFLLCTDGLTDYVKDREISQQLREEPMVACVNLVEMANDRGGNDNTTVLVVQVQQAIPFKVDESQATVTRKRKKLPPLAILGTMLAFLVLIFWFSNTLKKEPSQPGIRKQTEEVASKPKKKEKTKRKKKKDKGKETPTQVQPVQLASVDQKLGASEAGQSYRELVSKLTTGGKPLQLKYFNNGQEGQMVYILPGQAIYINYFELQARDKYNMSKDQIEALIALAVVQAQGKTPLSGSDWEQKLLAPGAGAVGDKAFSAARELYKRYDDVNADGLFNSDNRFGKYRNLIKAGTYNFTIPLPTK